MEDSSKENTEMNHENDNMNNESIKTDSDESTEKEKDNSEEKINEESTPVDEDSLFNEKSEETLKNEDNEGAGINESIQDETNYGTYDTHSGKQLTERKKEENYKRCLIKGVLFALIFGGAAGAAFSGMNHVLTNNEVNIQLTKTAVTGVSTKDITSITDIIEECMPSVVSITNVGTTEFQTFFGTYSQKSQSSGSGIIIGKNDTELLIVTNNHVISNADEISVYFNSDGQSANNENVITAKVKGRDANKDIAVLSVLLDDIPEETLNSIKIATIGDSSELKVGESVIAIGNSYGYGMSVTSGIISARDREVTVQSNGQIITNKLIQTDAAINPGNSGGALLNTKGEVIGINSVKFISEDVEGMGYAIPISDVETIIDTFMNKETRNIIDEQHRGYLGISAVDVSSDISETYNLPKGIYVHDVTNDKSTLKAGDIITEINGSTITDLSQLQDELNYYKIGETVKLKINRLTDSEYKEMEIETQLVAKQAQ